MANVFLQPLASVVGDIHSRAAAHHHSQAIAIDDQGNLELLPTRGTPATQAIARRAPEIAGYVSPKCDRRSISAMLLRRMSALISQARPR